MSSIPDDLSYTKEHEWVAGLEDGLTVTVGITAYAMLRSMPPDPSLN